MAKAADLGEYARAKAGLVEGIALVKIHGVALEDVELDSLTTSGRMLFPVAVCLCVMDTPENPCPCKDPVIVWLPLPDIKHIERSHGRTSDGREIREFHLRPEARVVVEQQLPMSALAFSKTSRRVMRSEGPPSLGWIGLAASLGWWIGTKVDDALVPDGVGDGTFSDQQADKMIETFGPAPQWLQDIF